MTKIQIKDLEDILETSSFYHSYDFNNPSFNDIVIILKWLIKLVDPEYKINFANPSTQKEKLAFINEIILYWCSNYGIKLDPEKIYVGDKESLKEICKISNYYKECLSSELNFNQPLIHRPQETYSYSDMEQVKKDIIHMLNEGAGLFEDIGQENNYFVSLNTALKRDFNPQEFQNSMTSLRESLTTQTREIQRALFKARKDKVALDTKIGHRSGELEKLKLRLESMVTLTPIHVEENEICRQQIGTLNERYVRSFRNLSFLEKLASEDNFGVESLDDELSTPLDTVTDLTPEDK